MEVGDLPNQFISVSKVALGSQLEEEEDDRREEEDKRREAMRELLSPLQGFSTGTLPSEATGYYPNRPRGPYNTMPVPAVAAVAAQYHIANSAVAKLCSAYE